MLFKSLLLGTRTELLENGDDDAVGELVGEAHGAENECPASRILADQIGGERQRCDQNDCAARAEQRRSHDHVNFERTDYIVVPEERAGAENEQDADDVSDVGAQVSGHEAERKCGAEAAQVADERYERNRWLVQLKRVGHEHGQVDLGHVDDKPGAQVEQRQIVEAKRLQVAFPVSCLLIGV